VLVATEGNTATAASANRPAHRLPRTTGALSGLIVIVLGAWGALVPFIGAYFHYAFGSYSAWQFSTNRLVLSVIPGVVAVIGGWLLLTSARRSSGVFGGWLAVAAGIWFAVGPVVSLLWHPAGYPIGHPMGARFPQVLEWLGFFFGIGVIIATLGAFASGRFVSRPRLAEDAAIAAGTAAREVAEPARRPGAARAE